VKPELNYALDGWGLVINNTNNTCVIVSGHSEIATTRSDNIDVRKFTPPSTIAAWVEAHGLTCENLEMLDIIEEPAIKILGGGHKIIGELVTPTVIEHGRAPAKTSKIASWWECLLAGVILSALGLILAEFLQIRPLFTSLGLIPAAAVALILCKKWWGYLAYAAGLVLPWLIRYLIIIRR